MWPLFFKKGWFITELALDLNSNFSCTSFFYEILSIFQLHKHLWFLDNFGDLDPYLKTELHTHIFLTFLESKPWNNKIPQQGLAF